MTTNLELSRQQTQSTTESKALPENSRRTRRNLKSAFIGVTSTIMLGILILSTPTSAFAQTKPDCGDLTPYILKEGENILNVVTNEEVTKQAIIDASYPGGLAEYDPDNDLNWLYPGDQICLPPEAKSLQSENIPSNSSGTGGEATQSEELIVTPIPQGEATEVNLPTSRPIETIEENNNGIIKYDEIENTINWWKDFPNKVDKLKKDVQLFGSYALTILSILIGGGFKLYRRYEDSQPIEARASATKNQQTFWEKLKQNLVETRETPAREPISQQLIDERDNAVSGKQGATDQMRDLGLQRNSEPYPGEGKRAAKHMAKDAIVTPTKSIFNITLIPLKWCYKGLESSVIKLQEKYNKRKENEN